MKDFTEYISMTLSRCYYKSLIQCFQMIWCTYLVSVLHDLIHFLKNCKSYREMANVRILHRKLGVTAFNFKQGQCFVMKLCTFLPYLVLTTWLNPFLKNFKTWQNSLAVWRKMKNQKQSNILIRAPDPLSRRMVKKRFLIFFEWLNYDDLEKRIVCT